MDELHPNPRKQEKSSRKLIIVLGFAAIATFGLLGVQSGIEVTVLAIVYLAVRHVIRSRL